MSGSNITDSIPTGSKVFDNSTLFRSLCREIDANKNTINDYKKEIESINKNNRKLIEKLFSIMFDDKTMFDDEFIIKQLDNYLDNDFKSMYNRSIEIYNKITDINNYNHNFEIANGKYTESDVNKFISNITIPIYILTKSDIYCVEEYHYNMSFSVNIFNINLYITQEQCCDGCWVDANVSINNKYIDNLDSCSDSKKELEEIITLDDINNELSIETFSEILRSMFIYIEGWDLL